MGKCSFAAFPTGCNSLDLESESTITDANYWKSDTHFSAFNVGLHAQLRERSYNFFILGEPRADIYGDAPFGGEATRGMEIFPANSLNRGERRAPVILLICTELSIR